MGTTPKKKRNRLSKRNAPKTVPKSAFSKALREGRELISAGDTENGLAALNKLASDTRNPAKRSKILLAIGESESRYSRHTEALGAYTKASQYANQAADADLTLSAGTGIIRSLLRSLRTEEAKTAAAQLLSDLETAEKQFADIQKLTPEQLAKQGAITVHARPPRLTVGLTKVANAFMESGLTEEARAFLQKAIQLSPNGASRARQALAKLALASDQPALAERYAREALLMGRFQAKTVAAWQLYLDARARQNLVPILEPDVLAGFRQHATGRIAVASTLSIARSLRAHGDPSWKNIASAAISGKTTDPVISAEIEKLLHADAKLFGTETPRNIAARSLKLFRAKDTSRQELVAHAKEYVRFSLKAGESPSITSLLKIAEKRFPANVTLPIRHAMALGAMMAQNYDLARAWLLDLTAAAVQSGQTEAWGKATWALARMESLLENNAEAAFWYMEVAAHPGTPPRFKIQAMLRGLKFLGKSGDNSTDIGQLTANIRAILAEVDDFRILLDAARQLALAGSNFTALTGEAAQMGINLAKRDAEQAATTQIKLSIYEYLSRKLHCDLVGQNEEVVALWNSHSDLEKSEFAATGGSIWYEYIRTVFLSKIALGMIDQAESLASSIVDGNQASPEGYVIVGSAYAEWLIKNREKDKAFVFFDWIVKEAPPHRKAASSFYWLALDKMKSGDSAQSMHYAAGARRCFAGSPSLAYEWELDSRALLMILKIQNSPRSDQTASDYPQNYLDTQNLILGRDLSFLNYE